MKKFTKFLVVGCVIAILLASCGSKNPVAGKKMAMDAGGMSVVYIFTENQFWLEGLDGVKLNYRYDKETASIIYTELDGEETTLPMSKFTEVK